MELYQKIHLLTSVTLIFLIGLATGYPIGYFRSQQNSFPEIQFTTDINEKISVLKLMEVSNGSLTGELTGSSIRIAYNNENTISINDGNTFEIPLNEIHLKAYYQAKEIPENTLFIASKSGKYYYSVFNKSAFNIVPKNRIYFSNESEAQKMGYLKKE